MLTVYTMATVLLKQKTRKRGPQKVKLVRRMFLTHWCPSI